MFVNTQAESIFSYRHPFVSTDAVVFSLESCESDSYRKLSLPKLKVLLYRREGEPFRDTLCLPGGFLNIDELPQDNIIRMLSEKTRVKECFLEQLYTFCDLERDPRARVISIAYLGLMSEAASKRLNEEAQWFVVEPSSNKAFVLRNDKQELAKRDLGFDHYQIIATAYERLQAKIQYSNIALHLLPEEFTLTQLQNVYEAILGKKDQAANFRRKVMDLVQETESFTSDKGHRPARLYRKR